MPVVNTSALSERIANWVMETACRQARAWELSGSNVRVAISHPRSFSRAISRIQLRRCSKRQG